MTRLGSIGRLQFIAPALIAAAVWAAYRWRNPAARFVSIFMALAFLSYVGQVLAYGVADNAMFELVTAVAIGIGCAFDDLEAIPAIQRLGLERVKVLVVCILIARLLISARLSPYLVLLSPDFRSSLSDRVSVMKAESHEFQQSRAQSSVKTCPWRVTLRTNPSCSIHSPSANP